MNNIIIAGRLTRDPELRATQSGVEVCNFSVAVDRRFKVDGERKADFFDCVAWRKTAAFVAKYFNKGDGITISGHMESREWTDKEGRKRISWELHCDDVEFALGRPRAADAGDGWSGGMEPPAGQYAPKEGEFAELSDDDYEKDLPF